MAGKQLAATDRGENGTRPAFARWMAVVAVMATTAVLATIDDPGLTCDEYYDAAAGRRLVTACRLQGWAFFSAENIERNYGTLTLHPPLGRWLLGWMQQPFVAARNDANVVSLAGARFAPALAFGWLVWLVGWTSARATGWAGGLVAAVAVALAPRMFAHAHFATLDMLAAVSFVSAVLALAAAYEAGAKGWQFGLAGVVWGLALATKIQGVLLLPPVMLWLAVVFRWQAWRIAAWWGLAGGLVFYLLWPWLWLAPVENLMAYLSSATERQSLNVYYMGQVWSDRFVPWHYPWVMFAATVPLGFSILGVMGLATSGGQIWHDRRRLLVAASWLVVMLVFSVPGAPVYDGVRLFLMTVPLWAIWAGYGAQWLFDRMLDRGWNVWLAGILMGAVVLGPLTSVVMYHPFQLSYYAPWVGGLAGASRLGFEVTYWGDSIDEELLEGVAEIPEGEAVLFGPNLAPYQAPAVEAVSMSLESRNLRLVGWDRQQLADLADCRWALIYQRRADLDSLDFVLQEGRVVRENRRQGVWLGRLYELPGPIGSLVEQP